MNAQDEREFGEFVAARAPALFRIAYALAGDRHAAEDLLQDALLGVAGRWRRVHDPEAYVRRALVHGRVSLWRRRRRVRDGPPPEIAVADHAGASTLRLTIGAALERLPPRQRAVIALRYVADLTEAEVADVLGVAVSTVHTQHQRAMRTLRAACPELGITEEVRS
jgi:RNA polymerase sigma-70 factor (sigma-E family)